MTVAAFVLSIGLYIVVGRIWVYLLQYIAYKAESEPEYSNQEIFKHTVLWPLSLITFFFFFFFVKQE